MSLSARKSAATLVAAATLALLASLLGTAPGSFAADEPPALNPFGPRPDDEPAGVPGYVETSDGKVVAGMVYMTLDKRLKIYDDTLQRQREIPLRAVKQIECKVTKEWVEKEWRFKELALNEKVYTGRSYPAREYLHTITLKDDREITGPLAEIIYVRPYVDPDADPKAYRPEEDRQPQRFLLHKRDKGEMGDEMKSLHYVKLIKLGEEALKEGQSKAGKRRPTRPSSTN